MIDERRVLQRVVAAAGCIPVAAGLYGVLFGVNGLAGGVENVS
ncbi:MAG TPA: DUF4345 domain-containing protein, partial [Methylobacterium sp.]|nr:DUF4345 domain-containing protein [Methylobacterium sp.]